MTITVRVTRIERGDEDLGNEQTFRIVTEMDNERHDVKRTDTQLNWLMNSMAASYPLSGHPQLPLKSGKLRAGGYDWEFVLRDEILSRFIADWLTFYLTHPKISKEALEPISAISASEEEIANIIKIPHQAAQPDPHIELPASLADSTKGSGLLGKMFSKFKSKKPSQQKDVVDHASAALLRNLLDQQLLERERHEGLKATTELMSESHEALLDLFVHLVTVEENMKKQSSTWTMIGKNLPPMKWWIGSSKVSVITPSHPLTTPRDSAFAQRIRSREAMKNKAQTTIVPKNKNILQSQAVSQPLVTPRRGSTNLTCATPRVSVMRSIPLPGAFAGESVKTVCTKYGYPNMSPNGRLVQKLDIPPQVVSPFPQEPLGQAFHDMLGSIGVYFNWMGQHIFSHSIGEAASSVLFAGQAHKGLHDSSKHAASLCQKISAPVDNFVATVEKAIEEHPGDAYFYIPVDGIEEVSFNINKLTAGITEQAEDETRSVREATVATLSDICVGFVEQNIAALDREVDGWAAISELLENDLEDPFMIPDASLPLEEKTPIQIPKLSLALSSPTAAAPAPVPNPTDSDGSPQTKASSSMMRDRSVDSFTLVGATNPSPSPTSTVSARGSTASAIADILNSRVTPDYVKREPAPAKDVPKATTSPSSSDSCGRESSPTIVDPPPACSASTSPASTPSPSQSRKQSAIADVYDDL